MPYVMVIAIALLVTLAMPDAAQGLPIPARGPVLAIHAQALVRVVAGILGPGSRGHDWLSMATQSGVARLRGKIVVEQLAADRRAPSGMVKAGRPVVAGDAQAACSVRQLHGASLYGYPARDRFSGCRSSQATDLLATTVPTLTAGWTPDAEARMRRTWLAN